MQNRENEHFDPKEIHERSIESIQMIIPVQDIHLMHCLSGILRKGGDEAESLRQQLRQITDLNLGKTGDNLKRTGADLIAFFRNSPLADVAFELERELERDKETSRTITF